MNYRIRHILTVVISMVMVLCIAINTIYSETESTSSPVGFHKFMFRNGWNFISFPFMPTDASIQTVFAESLIGGESEAVADRIITFDPVEGRWESAWRDTLGIWQGLLIEDSLRFELSYWVFIREDHPDSQIVEIFGSARNDEVINRGIFEPGLHFIGSIWSGILSLDNAGLDNAGIESSSGLFPSDPGAIREGGVESVLAYDNISGWYQVAWYDGGNWHGDFNSFKPGRGYYLWLKERRSWFLFRRPDQTNVDTQQINMNNDSPVRKSIPVDNYDAIAKDPRTTLPLPPIPYSKGNAKKNKPEKFDSPSLKRSIKR
ncbi:MAG: hypothetical protein P9L92_00710 [Candidatus Electryonea clarkiae]|nr:hypothetical protein [Candidatus Electryonea clarkiae]MDP8287099.1 hypothetical protein [Candidatus Electryonea clarkiae]